MPKPKPRTSILQLRKADWGRLEADVVTRIHLLKSMADALEPNPTTEKIANDLIVPAIALLGQFCSMIDIEESPLDAAKVSGLN